MPLAILIEILPLLLLGASCYISTTLVTIPPPLHLQLFSLGGGGWGEGYYRAGSPCTSFSEANYNAHCSVNPDKDTCQEKLARSS